MKGFAIAQAIRQKTGKKMNKGGSVDCYADGGEIPEDNTDPGGMNKTPNVPSLPEVQPAYSKGGGEGGGGGLLGGIMKIIPMVAAMASDKEGKENIEGADSEMDDFLSNIEPEAYDYKNPKAPGAEGGRQYGVMAQDLERSRAGSSVVDDTSAGKMINSTRALGVTMGALGRLNNRVKKLESLKKFAGGGEVNDDFLSDEENTPLPDESAEGELPEMKRKRLISKAFDAVRRRQTGSSQ